MEDFILKIQDLFEDTNPESIKFDTKFRDLDDWNSIMGLSIIGMIDDDYGVEFNAEDMRQCQTIEDLYKRVQSKK